MSPKSERRNTMTSSVVAKLILRALKGAPVKNVAEEAANIMIIDACSLVKEASNVWMSDYVKRRNVGFKIGPAITGAYDDTVMYYNDKLSGKEPRVMNEAVIFDKT